MTKAKYAEDAKRLHHVYVRFDKESFEEIKNVARLKGWSVAETIRTFCEWGLGTVDLAAKGNDARGLHDECGLRPTPQRLGP